MENIEARKCFEMACENLLSARWKLAAGGYHANYVLGRYDAVARFAAEQAAYGAALAVLHLAVAWPDNGRSNKPTAEELANAARLLISVPESAWKYRGWAPAIDDAQALLPTNLKARANVSRYMCDAVKAMKGRSLAGLLARCVGAMAVVATDVPRGSKRGAEAMAAEGYSAGLHSAGRIFIDAFVIAASSAPSLELRRKPVRKAKRAARR